MTGPRITEVSLSLCRFIALLVALQHSRVAFIAIPERRSRRVSLIALCTVMYLVNGIQLSSYTLRTFVLFAIIL